MGGGQPKLVEKEMEMPSSAFLTSEDVTVMQPMAGDPSQVSAMTKQTLKGL
jgi:hypothetical protein